MDAELEAWARRVKRRKNPPPLWLFTDPAAMPDLEVLIARLPPGLCGVVFRHDGVAGRAALAARVAPLCRRRRITLVVAGDVRLAWRLRAGVHLRAGRRGLVALPPRRLITAAVHHRAELSRARRAGAAIMFISPAFATASHPGRRALGPIGWRALARAARPAIAAALGGVSAAHVRILGKNCRMAGAIGAFLH